mmetsp:Transcript_106930/g.300692  ORF Transcript_106930/g.300692 Transcript_106930/m.300692 type:complete len:364 (+) Transcript_106930:157-1248(+)
MAHTNGGDRLFVTKIPQAVTRDDLAAYFTRFGVTTDVYMPMVPGVPGHKGIAFVSFQDPAALQLTMAYDRHEVNGYVVVVDVATPRGATPPCQAVPLGAGLGAPGHMAPGQARPSQRPQPTVSSMSSNAGASEITDRLFVTKVSPNLQMEHLREYFAQFGDLTDVYMPSVPGSPTHKGICFVSFADPASVQVALKHSPHEIYGMPVVVDVATPRGTEKGAGRPPAATAFNAGLMPSAAPWVINSGAGQIPASSPAGPPGVVGGIAVPGRLFVTRCTLDMTRTDLIAYFQQFGDLTDVFVPSGGKGIAFVSFTDAAVAQRVLEVQQHFVKPGQAVLVDQAIDRPPIGAGGGKGGGFGTSRFSPY